MRFNATVTLCGQEFEVDENGSQRAVATEREVFCNPMSVGFSARLAGAAEGLMAAQRVRVRALEYRGEQFAVYQGRHMTVDSVSRNGEFATLTMTERLGGGHGDV